MKNVVKKVAAVVIAVPLFILLLYGAACSTLYPMYFDFMIRSVKHCDIPLADLGEGFVPQGTAYIEEGGYTLICGYMTDKSPSRILVIAEKTSKTVLLKNEDGSDYTGHAGGISTDGGHIWISNAGKAFHLTVDVLLSAADRESVSFDGAIASDTRASFTFADEEYLWVGEYAKGEDYPTAESHKLTASDGSEHHALIFAYQREESAPLGVASDQPVLALSVTDQVQGFAVTDAGNFLLSVSGGLSDSCLYCYNGAGEGDAFFTVGETEIPLFYLDNGRKINAVRMPHMSEDLDYTNGKVIIGFESAAMPYGFGFLPHSLREYRALEVK